MSNSKHTFGGRLRPKEEKPTSWEQLIELPNERTAFIYQRLSSHEQVKKSIYSIKAQDSLVDLAREDGYADEQIYVGKRDLGISGTKGREDRPELAHLIDKIEAGNVEAVYVVHISRLYRDQTLINALALGELFKQHNVILVTPQMRFNLKDKMHLRLFRMEVERAADELELMALRLHGAQELKARQGLWAGECLPAGFIVDECKNIGGKPNPDYHSYWIYEPHAEVVRIVFDQLAMPGMGPTKVMRYCGQKGIVLEPFPPELATPANMKGFATSHKTSGGAWAITLERVRRIATNPAYIGWKFWAGEVISKSVYPPIIDEDTFWTVQRKFKRDTRAKKGHDPLPLGGLLYCGDHDVPRRMVYQNKVPAKLSHYECREPNFRDGCQSIVAHHLDGPISEAVIETVTLPDVATDVLSEIMNEYEAAKEQAASYRREKKRLENEIENLRGNLATAVMSTGQLEWLDQEITNRLARIKELADLENQPVGEAVGRPVPGKQDIEMVRDLLETLDQKWDQKSNGLKNALLRLLLDQVIIWPEPSTIRVRLVWRFGPPSELTIHRPYKKTQKFWTKAEVEILEKHYPTASIDELLALFPGRSWSSILGKAHAMKLYRSDKLGIKVTKESRPYTPEEDELIRRYYGGEGDRDELLTATGRRMTGINHRASKLGLKFQARHVSWEWSSASEISSTLVHA